MSLILLGVASTIWIASLLAGDESAFSLMVLTGLIAFFSNRKRIL